MWRNDLTDPVQQLPEILAFEDRVLDEDLVVLEAYADMAVSADLHVEISTRADRLSVAYRCVLGELILHALAIQESATMTGGGSSRHALQTFVSRRAWLRCAAAPTRVGG